MSFVFYLSVLLFTAAAALFGLDRITAPLPPNPAGRIEYVAKPATSVEHVAKPQADQASLANARDKLARGMKQAAGKGDPEHKLSPLYPANPGGVPIVDESTGTVTRETTGAAGADDKPAQQSQHEQARQKENESPPQKESKQAVASDNAAKDKAAQADAKNEAAERPQAQPAEQRAPNSCDVAACAARYLSFRASDCTYQPYDGPRQVCEPSRHSQRSSERSRERDEARGSARDAELRDLAQRRDLRGVYDRDDAPYDAPEHRRETPAYRQPRLIILPGNSSWWR